MRNLLDTKYCNSRTVALQILLESHKHDAFAQELLDKALTQSNLAGNDRRLTTQLVYGVLRRRGTLDALLQTAVKRPRERVEPWLWEALRLGVYQLALLSHIPPHAAIHETVELATAMGKPRGKGFLNGVLRNISRVLTDDFGDSPAVDALPFEDGRYRKLRQAMFADPTENRIEYFASAFSFPRWLVRRWLERSDWNECMRLGFWFNCAAPLWLRCNTVQTNRDTLLSSLRESAVAAEPGEHPHSIRLLEHAPVSTLPAYERGWFSVQDESAMSVATALAPAPGSRVLDLCSAPGGKTTHLAEIMQNKGEIIACDIDAQRLAVVENLCERLGINIVKPHLLNLSENDEPPPGPFDAVLVDVPCSNTGVLGKRPEARWRLKPIELPHLVKLQTKLLLQAVERVRPGGAIVYSTCSMEPEENQNIVRTVLTAVRDMRLEEEKSSSPGEPADGGYWARLRKKDGS